MKRVTLGFSILTAAVLFFVGCKKTPNVPPEQDSETQSAIDAVWATYVVSDLDMVCSFLGENTLLTHFYTPVPPQIYGPGNGTFTAIRDISSDDLTMTWNLTKCLDGRLREGTVFMNFHIDPSNPDQGPNSKYYRVPGFQGLMTLTAYKIDGWEVDEWDNARPTVITNIIKDFDYKTNTTNLKWTIDGKFKFTHPTDTNRNIIWEGKITKTLMNTSDPKVIPAKKDAAITWSIANVSYEGDIWGFTSRTVPFKMHVEGSSPLVRDFTCRPDKIEGVALTNTPGTIISLNSEHHPFIKGIASFTTAALYPRQIYFGNEGNVDLASQCDNTGEVLIKGISYRVDFRK